MARNFRETLSKQVKLSGESKSAVGRERREVCYCNSGGVILPTSPDSHHQKPCESSEGGSFKEKLNVGISNFMTELQERYLSTDAAFQDKKENVDNIQKRDLNPNWDQQETRLRDLSRPLMGKEQKKFAKAFRAISRFIYQSIGELHAIEVSPEGSYRHATNIPGSDLEIDIYFLNSLSPRSIAQFREIRNLTEKVLVGKYGREKIKRDNMVFNINGSESKISIDVLVAFLYKSSIENKRGKKLQKRIKEFYNDKNKHFVDHADQGHIDGVEKHKRTGRRFKTAIRILKRIRNEMRNSPDPVFREVSKGISSLLIEAMVYHVPDSHFGHKFLKDDIKSILRYCIDHTRDDHGCKEWTRLYNPAPLFSEDHRQPGTQEELWTRERGWTREQAHKFLLAVQDSLGFNTEGLSEVRSQLKQQIDQVSKHIDNFKKYMIDHKDALTYALTAICVKKQVFDDMLEKSVLCRDGAMSQLNAGQQDSNKLLRDHEILQSINQGLDKIHQRLLEKLATVGSSAQEVNDLGADFQALFGMNQEAIGNIEQKIEKENGKRKSKKRKDNSMNGIYKKKNSYRK